MHPRSIVAGSLMAATIALPTGVSARPRPRFEPTDLEWEATGVFDAHLDLSVVGILGILPGDDRYGLLFGFEPKLRLFDAPPARVKEEDKQDP